MNHPPPHLFGASPTKGEGGGVYPHQGGGWGVYCEVGVLYTKTDGAAVNLERHIDVKIMKISTIVTDNEHNEKKHNKLK